ncbi:MAG: hypothetical protein AAFQ63_12445 [Cyanobacteria bacterium J06621_11]
MGRARNLFDLALAVGAIAGSAAVLSPQMLWGDSNMQQLTSAQAVSSELDTSKLDVSELDARKELPLAPFVGIAQFVKNPDDYSIVVDQQEAKVTDAALDGDRLEIEYVQTEGNKNSAGKLRGTLSSDGVFTESRSLAAQIGSVKETASFTFEADGTANPNEGDRAKATHIFR